MEDTPIFKAKKKNSDEYVEGYYFKDAKSNVIITHSRTDLDSSNGMYVNCFEIDISTLEICDDIKFRKLSEVNFRTDYEIDMHSYNGYCCGWNSALKENSTPPYKIYESIKNNK